MLVQAIVFPRKSNLCPSLNCRTGCLFLWLSLFTQLLWHRLRSEEARIPAAGKTEEMKHLCGASVSLTSATPPLFLPACTFLLLALSFACLRSWSAEPWYSALNSARKFAFLWVIHDSCQREVVVS